MTRTRVKICGITNVKDAHHAVQCGADALGFIFVPNTPRFVGSHAGALEVPALLPLWVTRTAVCRDFSEIPTALGTHYDALQFYQYDPRIAGLQGRVRLVQVFRVRDANSLEEIDEALHQFRPDALQLDTYHPQHLGGVGATFDWSVATEARRRFNLPLILAGGLTPENVGDAIRQVRPYGVDVSSGVEAEPGRKDFAKVRAFLAQVCLADAP